MAGPDQVDVRVGIVSWNTGRLLARCLDALPAALGDLRAEVVVVDNASSDESVAVAGRPDITVVARSRNVGYAVAMNQALAGTAAPVLLALNPDTEPAPGSLATLVAELRARPDVGVVVPRLVGTDGRPQHSVLRLPTALPSLVAAVATERVRRGAVGRWLLLDGGTPPDSGPVPWAIGAVHVIRAAALEDEAPYAERAFMYAEDLELCWRLGQQGWATWLASEVEVAHVGNAAGAVAWGSARSARFWEATYDVVALRRSRGAARRLAVGAALASVLAASRSALPALVGERSRRPERRAVTRGRLAEARLHARVARAGPPPPDTSPPSERS